MPYQRERNTWLDVAILIAVTIAAAISVGFLVNRVIVATTSLARIAASLETMIKLMQ